MDTKNNNIRTFETADYQSITATGEGGLGGPQRRTHRVTTPKDNFQINCNKLHNRRERQN
jgi:hypothetical protein